MHAVHVSLVIEDTLGRTSLSMSVESGNIQVIEILLDFDANMEVSLQMHRFL